MKYSNRNGITYSKLSDIKNSQVKHKITYVIHGKLVYLKL